MLPTGCSCGPLLLMYPPPSPSLPFWLTPPFSPQLVSEFQAFKHMECLAPGTIQKAASPLEVTLSIQPTLVLQNALPYEMRVLLWQHLPSEAGSGRGAGDASMAPPTVSGFEAMPPQLSPVRGDALRWGGMPPALLWLLSAKPGLSTHPAPP